MLCEALYLDQNLAHRVDWYGIFCLRAKRSATYVLEMPDQPTAAAEWLEATERGIADAMSAELAAMAFTAE